MNLRPPHRWDLTPSQAIALQKELAGQVITRDDFGDLRVIAGADLALDETRKIGFAGVILFEFPSLKEMVRVSATGPIQFPYIPGLLSFREGPILLEAFRKLPNLPDLILFDGQGVAHPRRFGIASHMGLILDRPTIGCAKSLLCGTYKNSGSQRGSWTPLADHGQVIGAVLRTRDRVKPIFVSVGHRVGLETAIKIVLQCHDGVRIPKPTREADRFVACVRARHACNSLIFKDSDFS